MGGGEEEGVIDALKVKERRWRKGV